MITELCRGGLPRIAKKSNRPRGTRFPADTRNHTI